MPIEETIQDWDMIKLRWQAWWQQEIVDRVVIAVTAPRDGVPPADIPAVDPETQWTDASFMIRRTLETNRVTYFGGEALPVFNHNCSVGHSLYLGCRPRFAADTIWVDPAPTGGDGYPTFGEDWRESPWWKWMLETTHLAAASSQGRYFMQSLWGNHAGDNLALARGTEKLLYDITENRDWVKSTLRRLSQIQVDALEAIWEIMGPGKLGLEGSLNYVGCWSPGRTMGFDCDFSCMISTSDFKEIFLPPLVETMQTVDHRIYHLDGPEAIHHLDALLALPELQAIQWVPGAGQEAVFQWIPLIRRVQEAGKSIAIASRPEEVGVLLRELRPEGLFISTSCTSEAEARQLLDSLTI